MSLKNNIKSVLGAFLFALLLFAPNKSNAECDPSATQTIEILGDMCWDCIFPLSIASVQIIKGSMPDPQGAAGYPICICDAPPPLFIRIGVPIGYFEPSRLIDTVKDPYCFTGLGFGLPELTSSSKGTKGDGHDRQRVFYQSHYYIYPILGIVGAFVDLLCFKGTGIDLAYITEVDPLWQDDELAALINPEAILFGNPITNLACVADSTSSLANVSIDALFWCKGAWGNAYPLSGNTGSKDYVEDAASVAGSMIYKLHRELILWQSSGEKALCGEYPLPIWKKSSYRLQIIAPKAHSKAMSIGQSGLMWSYAKNRTVDGDNFSFLLFKKNECCML